MKLKELFRIISNQDPESEILIKVKNIDETGEIFDELIEFDKYDVVKKRNAIIIDISDK